MDTTRVIDSNAGTQGIQAVDWMRTITLSILFMSRDKRFIIIEERRSAVIPSQFSEIAEWMSVFQLLAHWMVSCT